jgi:hypothetical protein
MCSHFILIVHVRQQRVTKVLLSDLKRNCWHHEQIHRNNSVSVIAEKCPPALRRWSPLRAIYLVTTRLPDVDAELDKFAMHPRCAPEWVGKAHRTDQAAYFERHRRPAPANSQFPTPIGSKPRSVPTDHGVWVDDRRCVASDRKPPKQTDEYQPIDAAEAWSLGAVRRRTLICWRSAKFSATRATLNRNSPISSCGRAGGSTLPS